MRLPLLLLGFARLVASDDSALNKPFSSSFVKLQHAPCVSLFYRYGRYGCGTEDRTSQIGKLLYFDGNLPNADGNYVAVVEDYMLTYQNIKTLLGGRGGPLQGVLVLNSTNSDGSQVDYPYYSPDALTPQGYNTPSQKLNYGYYSYKWNSNGQSLFSYDLHGIPMALVVDSDLSKSLRQESQSASTDNAIVAEFSYYMGMNNMDSQKCLAWKDAESGEWSPKCLPLGGSSVWATAGSPPNPSSENGQRSVVMITAGMDSTSFFHDVAPGANTAASNILTLLMAAKLIGENVNDKTLDGLTYRIVFALFQGETYGFLGSRAFLRDLKYPGFKCYSSPVHSVARRGEESGYACLDPVRPSLAFADLGDIAGMLSVDQVGHTTGDGVFYVHADQNNDKYGKFMANLLLNLKTNYYSVAQTSVGNSGDGYPYPPTPLTSLLSLSGGSVGGAVLTGYDYAFTNKAPYHSHLDTATRQGISYKSIAAAATLVARAAVAAAYDGGNYAYSNSAQYAAQLIPELDYEDADLVEVANCLFSDGQCKLIRKYSSIAMANERVLTGMKLGSGSAFGTPPSYYVGVYNAMYGQPFAQVGDNIYGAYDGRDYGNKDSDAVGMVPSQLESAIHGLLDDYLGRGTVTESDPAIKCEKLSDCSNVDYCSSYGESAVCTGGGLCVCSRAHYHVAIDEALKPSAGKSTGYFEIKESDYGYSPIYTEPYWSNDVGVKVYRDVGWLPGFFTLVSGLVAGGFSLFAAFVLKVGLKKDKLY